MRAFPPDETIKADKEGSETSTLPDDPVGEMRAPYRMMLRYGPWGLAAVGLLMICGGLFLKRPDAVLIALIVIGTGTMVAGVLLPRVQGDVEVGTHGLKAAVQGISRNELTLAIEAAQVAVEEVIEGSDKGEKEELVTHSMLILLSLLDRALSGAERSEVASRLHHPSSTPHGLIEKYPEVYAAYLDLMNRTPLHDPP